MRIVAADHILPAARSAWIDRGALVVGDGTILAIGRQADILPAFADLPVTDLGAAVVLPGLVNAHQHGRGISPLLMGYGDDALEPWIAGRRRHGPPDIYAVTRLAAEEMLANGVTATVHANYSYGSGAYEDELDAAIRAYDDSGIRATICVGFQDRGFLVYPDGAGGGRAPAAEDGQAPYAGDLRQTIDLMERLQARHRDAPRIRFAYGPAGPQWVGDAAWRGLARDAAARGVGLHFHLLESPAQELACRRLYGASTLAALQAFGVFDARTSCAHGVYMTAQDLTIARESGLVIVSNPGSNLRLFNGVPPLSAFYDSGCSVALGTDNCALSDDEDYLRELRLGAALARSPGIDARGPSAQDMLHSATAAGAAAAFLPDGAGRLETGGAADLIALSLAGVGGGRRSSDAGRLDLVLARAGGADVVMTMVEGNVLFEASPADQDRRDHWRRQSLASVETRHVLRPADSIAALQESLRQHYRAARKADGPGARPGPA